MPYTVSERGTFDNLTPDEAALLYQEVEAMVSKGERSEALLGAFAIWCEATELKNDLLTLSTIFTTKVLLSLTRHYVARTNELETDKRT